MKGHLTAIALLVGGLAVVGCSTAVSPAPSGPRGPASVTPELVSPPRTPAPIDRSEPTVVRYEVETIEQTGQLAEGVEYRYWTFGGTVPGPMLRVRQGDTVEISLKNASGSRNPHSIDLHAVTGPGGGAAVTQTGPGLSTGLRFKALNPGLYVYHCATPPVPEHVANGMYGLILVEPPGGLPRVDHEYYVMQGDFYTQGSLGQSGSQSFAPDKMLAENPEYVVFNGSTTGLVGDKALAARVGETVRIYFGVGGPNMTSSFHVIGEIFDRVYPEGAMEPLTNVQTTRVPAGGAAIVDMKLEVPGAYLLVDHSLSRLLRGAVGHLNVAGEPAPWLYTSMGASPAQSSGMAGH